MTFEEWYEKYNREEDDNHPHWLLKSAYNFALHEAPEGYVLVPEEPTEDIVWEAIRVMDEGMITVDQVDVKLAYKAMIQAAQEEEGCVERTKLREEIDRLKQALVDCVDTIENTAWGYGGDREVINKINNIVNEVIGE